MRNPESGALPTSTGAVLRKHLQAATVGVDALMDDYTEHSVLISHEATYRGLAEIRSFFTALLRDLPARFFERMSIRREEVVGEVAYIHWDREPFFGATDTFVVRDGKIAFQTFTP
jgi:hypothetical protein